MSYLLPLLGWVLVHAASQTCAVALLLCACLRRLRRASAALRYRCAVGHLAAAVAAVALTLIVSHAGVAAGLARAALSPHGGGFAGRPDRALPFLRAAGWIWLGGIAAAQAALALHWIRLRSFLRCSAPAGSALDAVVRELSEEFHLTRPPEVRCADVRSPMVAGRWPAFLLAPRSFCDSYPPAEVRALVAHELAHIQRRDYSANLLHLGAASLLWWHPAAWLIYARVRHERECSTDERAVRLTGSAVPLAKALLRLADGFAAGPAVLAAHSDGLGDRIARLAGTPADGSRETVPRFLGGAILAMAGLIAMAGPAASHRDDLTRAYAASAAGPPIAITIHAHDPAGAFQVRMLRGRVTAIDLGDVRVPPERVLQTGDTVRVVGKGSEELLRLQVDPRGGMRWRARRTS